MRILINESYIYTWVKIAAFLIVCFSVEPQSTQPACVINEDFITHIID